MARRSSRSASSSTTAAVVEPTNENIATKKYPLSRPLFLLTNGEPHGAAKTLVDFVLSERGQELVKKHGYLRLKDLEVTPPAMTRAWSWLFSLVALATLALAGRRSSSWQSVPVWRHEGLGYLTGTKWFFRQQRVRRAADDLRQRRRLR